MRLALIPICLCFLLACNIVMVEEKYVATEVPFVDGSLELIVHADGKREPTDKLLIKEQSPYKVRVWFRTKDTHISGLQSVTVEVPEFNKKVIAENGLIFGEPSSNPQAAGYRSTDLLSTEPIAIDFDVVRAFDVIILYEFELNQQTIRREVRMKMKKDLIRITETMARIGSV